MLYKLSDVIVV